jgi:hypothetical protein
MGKKIMKYWTLVISLLVVGCGGGASDGSDAMSTEDASDEAAATVGREVSDTLQEAEDAARDVGDKLQQARDAVDNAVDEAEDVVTD